MAKVSFEPGDPVVLIGGHTIMTVIKVSGSNVDCTWHDQQGKPLDRSYPAVALKLYTPDIGNIGKGSDL